MKKKTGAFFWVFLLAFGCSDSSSPADEETDTTKGSSGGDTDTDMDTDTDTDTDAETVADVDSDSYIDGVANKDTVDGADSDAETDSENIPLGPPRIDSINGDGTLSSIVDENNDLDLVSGTLSPALNRFGTSWIVTGEFLDDVEHVSLVSKDGEYVFGSDQPLAENRTVFDDFKDSTTRRLMLPTGLPATATIGPSAT